MATFVLLHGSFHAAWNWHKVTPLLEARGHRAVAVDLPGHGRDRRSPRRASLRACVEAVLEVVDATEGDVVLVAHSRNGIVISQAAEARAAKIHGLVYLAAYLVPNGKSMMDYSVLDPASLVLQNVDPPFDRRRVARILWLARSAFVRWLLASFLPRSLQTHALRPAAYKEALYHDCGDEITALASALLEPESNWANLTPLRLTERAYGRVPKVYIECTQDRAVTLGIQRRMQEDSPCDRVLALDTGHSPFFSRPEGLVLGLLESLVTFARAPG